MRNKEGKHFSGSLLTSPHRDRSKKEKHSESSRKPIISSLGRHDFDGNRVNDDQYYGLYALPWDERDTSGYSKKRTSSLFGAFVVPRFWERVDWTFRCAILCILPAALITLSPKTREKFVLPGLVFNMALWISAPTLGEGLESAIATLKAFGLASITFLITIAAGVPHDWPILIVLGVTCLIISSLSDTLKKSYCFSACVFALAYQNKTSYVDYYYVGSYVFHVLIGMALGTVCYLIPFPALSINRAKRSCGILGNTLSLSIQGLLSSFWVPSVMQREINIAKISLLRQTVRRSYTATDKNFNFCYSEPHTGRTLHSVASRISLLKTLIDLTHAMAVMIEVVEANPDVLDNPTCIMVGNRLASPLGALASVMDILLLRISDFNYKLTSSDTAQFRNVYLHFKEVTAIAREEFMLDNPHYEPDTSDIYLGFFLFLLDQICELLVNFEVSKDPPTVWRTWIYAPRQWIHDARANTVYLITSLANDRLTRRCKEAIKLSGSLTAVAAVQRFVGSTDPLSGAAIIPWMYQKTGADTFLYCVMRVLGTVFGSVIGFVAVKLSRQSLPWVITGMTLCSVLGAFIQSSPTWRSMGTAMLWAIVSISVQYQNKAAAQLRVQQNVFAGIVYLVVATVVWPKRSITHIFLEEETILLSFRKGVCEILHGMQNLDDFCYVTHYASECIQDINGRIGRQRTYVKVAPYEPTISGTEFPSDLWEDIIQVSANLNSILGLMKYCYFSFSSSLQSNSVHWVLVDGMAQRCADTADLLYATIDLYLLIGNVSVPTKHMVGLRVALMATVEKMEAEFCKSYMTLLNDMRGATPILCEESSPQNNNSTSTNFHNYNNQGGLNMDASSPIMDAVSMTKHFLNNAGDMPLTSCKFSQWTSSPANKNKLSEALRNIAFNTSGSRISSKIRSKNKESLLAGNAEDGIPGVECKKSEAKSGKSEGSEEVPLKEDRNPSFVLTNEDIHSIFAFLFCIRAIVNEVGALEKLFLELKDTHEGGNKS